jgi:outer membrane protein assembly factor BamB
MKQLEWIFCAAVFASLSRSARPAELPRVWDGVTVVFSDSCPAIDASGVIYLTMSGNAKFYDPAGGKLVAINPNGSEKWAYSIRSEIKSSPALGADGTIYFGGRDRKLHAVNSTGKAKWSFSTGGWVDSSPAIGTNGVIYFGAWDKKFYALNPDGTKKWEFSTGGPVDSSPAIAADGTIYVGSHDTKFYALNPDGSKKWEFATGGAVISSPAIGAGGVIYFSSVDGRLYALNPEGRERWHCWTGGVGESSPIIDAQGNICLGVNNVFSVIKPDGTTNWSFGYPVITGSAIAAADGTVYFGGTVEGVGILYGWNPDGTPKSNNALGGAVTGSPAMANDGTIYISSASGKFHALKADSGLAKSPWPKFRGNASQTGRIAPN